MPRIVDHDARRDALAHALWRVVERDGIAAGTMRAVAAEAGWSTGVLAHYFSDMDALVTHSFALISAEMDRRAARAAARAADPLTALTAALAQALPLDARRRREATVWFGHLERARHRPAIAAVAAHHYDRWCDATAGRVGALTPAPADPAAVAEQLVALVDGLAVRALARPRALPRRRQLALLANALATLSGRNASAG